MYGQSNWKEEIQSRIDGLEQSLIDMDRTQTELKSQNAKLAANLRTVTKKLIMRLPISIESLEKGLNYDLIFSDEIESWMSVAREGIILDLRPFEEFKKSHLDGAINIPLDQLERQLDKLPSHRAYLLVCENGIRSVSACEILGANNYSFLYVLKGGMSNHRGRTISQSEASAEASA
jgi:rhodanese-related sulfurtransferase